MPDRCHQNHQVATFIQHEAADNWFNTNLSLYHCSYDMDCYDDSLYQHFGVAFPETMHKAVVKRRAEFLAGRYCALKSLQHYNIKAPTIEIGKHRNPLWPNGILGSISHSNDSAVAVTSDNPQLWGIGIDIEAYVAPDTLNRIQSQILCDDELSLVLHNADNPAVAFTMAFSLKESFFKAAFLSVGRYFDFYAVSLTSINWEAQTIEFRINENLSKDFRKGYMLNGAFCMPFDKKVVTMVTLDK